MTVGDFLAFARQTPRWQVLEPCGDIPPLPLPDDLRELVVRSGGVRTPAGLEVGMRLVSAQETILGERHNEDRSANWFVVAEEDDSGTAARAVIDLAPERLGRVYEAFWDVFGIVGSQPVIATSFTDFLTRLVESSGRAYWVDAELGLGDAYD